MEIKSILTNASDETLSELIINSFREVEKNYHFQSWKTSELDAGHFVEAIRRLIELKLYGQYTKVSKPLQNFTDKVLSSYQNKSGDEAYRIHIPRVLYTIYGIRNKRGVGHISQISPNKIDATLILASCKWVLAEVIRINSNYQIEETGVLIDEVIQRNIEGIWQINGVDRIMIDGLKLPEQILFILYNKQSCSDIEISQITEYKNFNYLKKVLKKFHQERLVEYSKNGECILSPKGSIEAEKIISKINGSQHQI
ncbi:hypothetical protein [Reichenbachiella agariperforans]|uniref:hypothetical protein n=1 Tax=Reichenbachiella agariperforans TaxID=156994 RepID=UPI001C092DC0|nr:hypothetical protein [Reichenbachiella agariperforans]MBU2914852.1 hypothetical protein [Reichenbachiella agariperforans]